MKKRQKLELHFKYDGLLEGVKLAEPLLEGIEYPALAIDYPYQFEGEYRDNLKPLISYGFAAVKKGERLRIDHIFS